MSMTLKENDGRAASWSAISIYFQNHSTDGEGNKCQCMCKEGGGEKAKRKRKKKNHGCIDKGQPLFFS